MLASDQTLSEAITEVLHATSASKRDQALDRVFEIVGGYRIADLACGSGVFLSAYYSYQASRVTQDRQVRLEQISKFDASSAQIIDASSAFIVAINENKDQGLRIKDIENARQKLGAVLAAQIHESENIRRFYDARVNKAVKEYQDAMIEMNQLTKKTNSSTEMRLWTESFGRVLDVKSALSQEIYSALGVALKGRNAG